MEGKVNSCVLPADLRFMVRARTGQLLCQKLQSLNRSNGFGTPLTCISSTRSRKVMAKKNTSMKLFSSITIQPVQVGIAASGISNAAGEFMAVALELMCID